MYYKQIMSLSMKVPSTCFETIFFIPDLVLVFSSHAYLQTYTDMFIICICSLVVLSFFLKKKLQKSHGQVFCTWSLDLFSIILPNNNFTLNINSFYLELLKFEVSMKI